MGIILSAITTQEIVIVPPIVDTFVAGTSTELLAPTGKYPMDILRGNSDLKSLMDSGDIVLLLNNNLIIDLDSIGVDNIAAYGGVVNTPMIFRGIVSVPKMVGGTMFIGQAASEHYTYTSSANWQNKLTLTTSDLDEGLYRVGYTYTLSSSKNRTSAGAQVVINSDEINYYENEPKDDKNVNGRSGFAYRTLSGVNTIEINFRKSKGETKTITISDARLEIFKIN